MTQYFVNCRLPLNPTSYHIILSEIAGYIQPTAIRDKNYGNPKNHILRYIENTCILAILRIWKEYHNYFRLEIGRHIQGSLD